MIFEVPSNAQHSVILKRQFCEVLWKWEESVLPKPHLCRGTLAGACTCSALADSRKMDLANVSTLRRV